MASLEPIVGQPLVFDNGSGVMKAGVAGETKPSHVFPTYVGRPKHRRVMTGGKMAHDVYIGKEVAEHRGALKIRYPMEHGVVTDWDEMEKIWTHAYGPANLKLPMEDHPVLLTEAPLNPTKNREVTAELFLEKFKVPALFVSPQATLSLYASGRTTGVVLDSGDGVSHVVPVYEGFAMPHAITRMDVAGRDVTEYFQLLLRKAGHAFHTSAEREIVRDIKETCCEVALDLKATKALVGDERPPDKVYSLPDGSPLVVGMERFQAPEVLFNPALVGSEYPGIHRCVAGAIKKTDLDLRKNLFGQIVLSGGSTLFSGIGQRLLRELRQLAPKDTKVRITAAAERQFLTWTGGSILASLASFNKMWISKKDFEEYGASIFHKKSL